MSNFFDSKTKSKVTNIAVKAAVGSIPLIGPAAVGAYELTQVCLQRAKETKNETTRERVLEFHDNLPSDGVPIHSEETITRDYTAIIESMIRDDEDEKVKYYSTLFQTFATNAINKDEKVYYLKWARDLTAYDLDMLRRVHIAHEFDVKGQAIKSGPLSSHSLGKLLDMRIVENNDDTPKSVSNIGQRFLKAIFSKDQLLPQSIGLNVFRPTYFSLVSLSDLSTKDWETHQDILGILSKFFYDEFNCRSSQPALLNSQSLSGPFFFTGKMVLVHDGKVQKEYLEKVSRRLIGTYGISICISTAPESDTLLPLMTDEAVLAYSIKDKSEINQVLDKLRKIFAKVWDDS